MDELYSYPIAITGQFGHCGNAFRADTYQGCEHGCNYCFANSRIGGTKTRAIRKADLSVVRKHFSVLEYNKKPNNITQELIKAKVPLHLGGLSDPFQPCEFTEKITLQFLEITNYFRYPIVIST
jgi:DNA repair photolyase